MEWLSGFRAVMDYIEENMDSPIEEGRITRLAGCSAFHFSRMFSSLAGISLGEYIRRRRLTMAAFDLQKDDAKVMDIALKYGYESADAFTRAFRRLHGIAPSMVKTQAGQLKAYPRLFIHISVKGDTQMEYRIEDIDFPLRFAVRREVVRTDSAFAEVPKLWAKAQQNGFVQRLIDMSWEKPECKLEGLLGIFGDTASLVEETFTLQMGCRYDGTIPQDMKEYRLPPGKYAVFPGDVVEAWKRLYTEWLPLAGYELADGPCIENYLAPDAPVTQELWVPIKQKD